MSATTNERTAETANPTPQRDARGRFARGNSGDPGNPFGRRLAQLREFLLRSATEENVERLANMIMEKAFAGDMAAAKLLLLYWIGKSKEVAEPDRVDVEEWELAKEHVVRPDMAEQTFASMPITIGIAALPAMGMVHEHQFADMLHHPEKYRQPDDDELTADELAEHEEMIREMRAARTKAASPSTPPSATTPTAPRPDAERRQQEPAAAPVHRQQTAVAVEFGDESDRQQTADSADSAAWLAELAAWHKRAG